MIGSSRKPFQPSICEVKMYGFIALNNGRSIDVRIVNTMIMLIVVIIGPIEFSAKIDNKKAREATVVMAIAAKAKEQ